ncbi:MAG: hypothetical protein CW338_01180 [Clostridiales bacterium]|nr:hypothetical protein [Clostridiales bacterium]
MSIQQKKNRKTRRGARGLLTAVSLFGFVSFMLLFIRTGESRSLILAFAVPLVEYIAAHILGRFFGADILLVSLVNFLCSLGMIVLYRIDPALGMRQPVYYAAGTAGMVACIIAVRMIRRWPVFIVIMMGLSLVLLALPLAAGREINGAKAWILIGGISFQPSEIVKVFLVLCVSYMLSRRQRVLSIVYAAMCILLLALQRDMGAALLFYFTVLVLIYVSTGSLVLTLAGLAAGVAAAYIGYTRFPYIQSRVAMWQDPWQDEYGKGYQIVMGLIAMVNGGLWGTGLGSGNMTAIPEARNDYIFAIIMNEFGMVFAALVIIVYVLIVVRGAMIARRSTSAMHGHLAIGSVCMLAIQTFVIIGGVIKLIPLTGVTLPFISSGGTSMVSAMCLIGLVQGVEARNRDVLDEDEEMAEIDERGART